MALLLWLPVISVTIFFLIHLLFVGQYSASTKSNQKKEGTMPPKRNRVQGGNAWSQASAAPQRNRGRARQELERGKDQLAATHIRVEEARRPQWIISSTVKDIMLEGITLRYNRKP
ncbi:retrotransposon hot spot (RHS) protein [Trypanosoma cruzi]|nr:retrotransposon hot spot (RHS) protein [Trypanosoma cruzi]